MKVEPSVKDPLFSVMEECKQLQSRADPFLRMVQAAPDAMCLLANGRQLHDMARFCTDPTQYCVLGVDPTFNLGEFSVTAITYRHLQLIDRQTKKPPVLVGPMLIHQKNHGIISFSCIWNCWPMSTDQLPGGIWHRWREGNW